MFKRPAFSKETMRRWHSRPRKNMCKYMVYSSKPMPFQIAELSLGWYSLNFLGNSKHSSGEKVFMWLMWVPGQLEKE